MFDSLSCPVFWRTTRFLLSRFRSFQFPFYSLRPLSRVVFFTTRPLLIRPTREICRWLGFALLSKVYFFYFFSLCPLLIPFFLLFLLTELALPAPRLSRGWTASYRKFVSGYWRVSSSLFRPYPSIFVPQTSPFELCPEVHHVPIRTMGLDPSAFPAIVACLYSLTSMGLH